MCMLAVVACGHDSAYEWLREGCESSIGKIASNNDANIVDFIVYAIVGECGVQPRNAELLRSLVQKDRNKRPTASEIVKELEKIEARRNDRRLNLPR
jgi:hypothetical protein